MRPGRPTRLPGVAYDRAGIAYHLRLGIWNRETLLSAPAQADLVVEVIHGVHVRTVDVDAYCVMPDHLHLLVRFRSQGVPLGRWVSDFKRWTLRLGRSRGPDRTCWQPGFYEHIVRSSDEELNIARYVLANPVRAGLVEDWHSYPWAGSLTWEL